MSTFAEIKENIRINLADAGVISYSANDINRSTQDAYDDIALLSRCIIKKETSIRWRDNFNYYNFRNFISDFCGVIAIFNNATNLWLCDNITIRDLDKISPKWELDKGNPAYWIPLNYKWTAIYPKLEEATSTDTYDLIYGASAPEITDDDNSPLIAADMQDLLEMYATADQLESFDEFRKAQEYWDQYYPRVEAYRDRVQNIAKADLIFTA